MIGGSDRPGERVRRAAEVAERLTTQPWRPVPPSGRAFRRCVAIGDPQAPFETFLEILDRHGLLGGDGRLDAGVALLTAGDHFDYDDGDLGAEQIAADGLRLLRWLAEHPPDQAILIAGNHDLSRVMEFWRMTDARFARARKLAREIQERGEEPGAESSKKRFLEEHPDIPTPGVALRDYASFTEAQRALVQALLLGGRFVLARSGRLRDGEEALFTHASVTVRDLDRLGASDERNSSKIARHLNGHLAAAVERVREPWEEGGTAPLELTPLYLAGGPGAHGAGIGREAGGLLYQRPADPETAGAGGAREFLGPAPRRFDPRLLPLGLLQIAGHYGHEKCLRDMGSWATQRAREVKKGGLRTLWTDGQAVVYDIGILPVPSGMAGLYMIDGEMRKVPAGEYPVMDVGGC